MSRPIYRRIYRKQKEILPLCVSYEYRKVDLRLIGTPGGQAKGLTPYPPLKGEKGVIRVEPASIRVRPPPVILSEAKDLLFSPFL